MRRAIFIDKDGTLIRDVPYNVDPSLVVIEDKVIEGLHKLSGSGYLFIVITNQGGLAHGYFNETQLEELRRYLVESFKEKGIVIDAFYYCPHHYYGIVSKYAIECDCRKPLPGLILQAAADFNIDLADSWMIGDILNDVEAGNRAGCHSILIDNGNETEWVTSPENRKPIFVAQDMSDAADYILQHAQQKLFLYDSRLEEL